DAQHTATTAVDGTFSIPNVPTVNGNIVVRASAVVNGVNLVGTSVPTPPVPAGTTNVGDIVLRVGRRLIVVQRDAGTVQIVKTAPLQLESSVSIGSDVIDVATSPDGTVAAVSSFSAQRVTFLNLPSQPPVIIGSVITPIPAEAVAFTPDGKFVLVTDGGGSTTIVAINVATRTIASTLTLPVTLQGVAVTAGNKVLANAFNNGVVETFNISAAGVLTDTGGVSSSGFGPINVAASVNGRLALVANNNSNNLGILRIAADGTVTANGAALSGFSLSQSISFLPDGTAAYALSCNGPIAPANIDSLVKVTDPGVATPIGFVPCYFGVHQITALASSQQVAVHTPTGVTLIDTSTNTINSSITLPGNDGSVGGIAVVP